MRTLLKRFRGYGWLLPLAPNDIRQDGTIHTFEEMVWKRMRDHLRETLVQRGSNPSSNHSSKALVGRLVINNEIQTTNQQQLTADINEYLAYVDEELREELMQAGLSWGMKDYVWASRHEISPKVLAISFQHFSYDLQKGIVEKQGIKSCVGWLKASLKRYGAYYSEGYMQVQQRRKQAEAGYLDKTEAMAKNANQSSASLEEQLGEDSDLNSPVNPPLFSPSLIGGHNSGDHVG